MLQISQFLNHFASNPYFLTYPITFFQHASLATLNVHSYHDYTTVRNENKFVVADSEKRGVDRVIY